MRRSEPGRDDLRGRNTHRLKLWGALAAILSLAVALSAPDALTAAPGSARSARAVSARIRVPLD